MDKKTTNIRIVQFLPTIAHGDAIGNDAFAIRDALENAGYSCDIFTETIDSHLEIYGISGIKNIKDYNDDADIIICHVSTGWKYMLSLDKLKARKIFIWHNITPPRFFEAYGDFGRAKECEEGLEQVHSVRLVPSLCLTPSLYNKAELENLGYLCPVHRLPILTVYGKEEDSDEELVSRYKSDGYVNILFVGRIAPNKRHQDIIDAFYFYHKLINPKSRLFLVGKGDATIDYCKAICEYPSAIGLDDVIFSGHVSDRQRNAYYEIADVFLCLSEHEGFYVPLLEAMQHKVPIVAYDSSAVSETLGGSGLLLKSKVPSVVAEAINRVIQDTKLRETLIANGTERLAAFEQKKIKADFLNEISVFIQYWEKKKTIFFDVTVQRRFDAGTGIQRLEKEELRRFYEAEGDYKVIPFYFDREGNGLLECETGKSIRPQPGDIIYSPDLSLDETAANKEHLDKFYTTEKAQIWFFVHDLIPVRFPETCSDKLIPAFVKWLKVIFRYTGIIGNSESTINDVKAWLAENPRIERNPNLRFGWVWSGCDFSSRFGKTAPAKQTANVPADATPSKTVRFLMVSTVEPRKMYDQAVPAFNLLKKKGANITLDIVGREGWKVKETVDMINGSPYFGTSLFWHKDGISDEELAGLYEKADAVIVASKWEGFGLAVTEGAYYGKPLILRDIPIFREIAGDNAFYFSGYEPEDLARAIEEWLPLFRTGKAPSSAGIRLTTWQDHTDRLLEILTG